MNTINKIAFGVVAATISLNASAGTFKNPDSSSVGTEASEQGTLTVTVPNRSVNLKAGSAIASGDRVYVTLSGGATFRDAGYALIGSGVSSAVLGSLENYTVGASMLEFKVTSAVGVTGREFLLSGSAASSTTAIKPVKVRVPKAGATTKIMIDAYNQDSLGAYDAYKEAELFRYANQFSAAFDTRADGVIDVNKQRLAFVGGGNSDVIAINLTSATLDYGVTLTDKDKVTLTLSGDLSGLKEITGKAGAKSAGKATINTALTSATLPFDGDDVILASGSAALTLTGATSQALSTREFRLGAVLELADEKLNKTLITSTGTTGKAGEWTINGLQAKVSQMSLNSTGFISWLKVANSGTTSVDIIADIIWTTAAGVEGKVSGQKIGTVDAGGVGTVGEAAILAAMGNPSTLVDAHLTITVTGPSNSVHLIAEKKASDGRTNIPVFYNNTGNDRTWFQ